MSKVAYLSTIILLLFAVTVRAEEDTQGWIDKGDAFYKQRAEGSSGNWASTSNIEKAVSAYLKAYEFGEQSEALVVRLLDAFYFYATYAERDEKRVKEALKRAIEIGENALKRYPESVGINYWMAGLWGRWGEVNGILVSAKKGVANKVREYAEKTVALDPHYAEGGGYRALGRLHFKAPKIPLILSWPSKTEALKFLRLAVEAGPENTTNHLFYAESLFYEGLFGEALKHIDFILNRRVSPEKVVEMLRDKREAEELKEKVLKRLASAGS